MQKNYFKWDEEAGNLCWAVPLDFIKGKKKIKSVNPVLKSNIYCPHSSLIFKFKDTLNFSEQTKYRKYYQRQQKLIADPDDVVLLQDIKDLTIYLINSPVSFELIRFLHQVIVDRFLRALILYMQSFLETYTDLGEKRVGTGKLAPNPLAGGARVRRGQEMANFRWVLAREYVDILMACQKEAKAFHHLDGGQRSFSQSNGEKDLRIFEGLIQFAHRVVWIALERKYKELIEVEIDRLFRSDSFNIAKRKFAEAGQEFNIPEEEFWILYGPRMPPIRKILRSSPLTFEILSTEGDYRLLSLGLKCKQSHDPRIQFLERVMTADEGNLPKMGIKLGILGMPRENYDLLLISQASEDDHLSMHDESSTSEKSERADEYQTLLPDYGSDFELAEKYPIQYLPLKSIGNTTLTKRCQKMWVEREKQRASGNVSEKTSFSLIFEDATDKKSF